MQEIGLSSPENSYILACIRGRSVMHPVKHEWCVQIGDPFQAYRRKGDKIVRVW